MVGSKAHLIRLHRLVFILRQLRSRRCFGTELVCLLHARHGPRTRFRLWGGYQMSLAISSEPHGEELAWRVAKPSKELKTAKSKACEKFTRDCFGGRRGEGRESCLCLFKGLLISTSSKQSQRAKFASSESGVSFAKVSR